MKLVWDQVGDRLFEAGVDHGVLYRINSSGAYTPGVAWNGLTSVSENPEGAEANDIYADNMKYVSIRSAETYGATIEAYTYPDEFAECDGTAEPTAGLKIGQQSRKPFGFCYRTMIGSDQYADITKGYKLHLIYNATASPSEKTYETINDSPDAISFSWEVDTTPVAVEGYKPTSSIEIDSTKVSAEHLTDLENILYGTEDNIPRLPLPDEVISIISGGTEGDETTTVNAYPVSGAEELSAGWLSLTSTGEALTPAEGTTYVLQAATTTYAVGDRFVWNGTAYTQLQS